MEPVVEPVMEPVEPEKFIQLPLWDNLEQKKNVQTIPPSVSRPIRRGMKFM
jgi:hypothetical protein